MQGLNLIQGKNISIHALREEGDAGLLRTGERKGRISIHALREEGDGWSAERSGPEVISIHALREEGDFRAV